MRTAAEVRNVGDAKLWALMMEGRDLGPKNGGCFMGKHALPQPLGASPAHTFTAAWGWLRLLAPRAERECVLPFVWHQKETKAAFSASLV